MEPLEPPLDPPLIIIGYRKELWVNQYYVPTMTSRLMT